MSNVFMKEIPLLRVYLVYAIGTYIGLQFPQLIPYPIPFIILSISLFTTIIVKLNYSADYLRKQTTTVNIFSFLCILLLGFTKAAIDQKPVKSHLSNFNLSEKTLHRFKLIQTLEEKTNSYQAIGQVITRHSINTSNPTTGKVLLYFPKRAKFSQMKLGDEFYVFGMLRPIESAKNPQQFNYADYLAAQQIFYQVFVDTIISIPLKPNITRRIPHMLNSLRSYLEGILSKAVPKVEERSIAQALLLGNKDLLSHRTKINFSNSGAMHVLAVSGLHVGIIYFILSHMLFFFNSNSQRKVILLISGIWLYAIITGGSPSVLRAATMFSFIAIGKGTKQHVSIYNLLAASALILTVFQANIILDIGFQLSYCAVISIIYFQPKIYSLYLPKQFVIDKIWILSSVSLSAQIGTLPISLYYFNQFPVYFLLSNILVIPAASLIIYLGILTFVSAPFDCLLSPIGQLLQNILSCLNESLRILGNLPGAVSQGWWLHRHEVILSYVFILILAGYLATRKGKWLIGAIFILLLLVSSFSINKIIQKHSNDFTVYHTKKESLIAFRSGSNQTIYTTYTKNEAANIRFITKNNALANQLNTPNVKALHPGLSFLSFCDYNIAILNGEHRLPGTTQSLDYVVLCHQDNNNLNRIHKMLKADIYIFDSTNNSYLYKVWKSACKDLNINCYFVRDSVAFEQKLDK